MYASVAIRVAEIARCARLLQTRSILVGISRRGAAGAGRGVIGLALASLMQFASFSTVNFQTFADLSFRFTLTPGIVVKTVLFSLAMGLREVFCRRARRAPQHRRRVARDLDFFCNGSIVPM